LWIKILVAFTLSHVAYMHIKNRHIFLKCNGFNFLYFLLLSYNLPHRKPTHKTHRLISAVGRVSKVMIGKYERDEAAPSIEAAKKIADALEVSLDSLVGEGTFNNFDKKTLQRFKDLEHLEDDKKKTLFDLIDTYIRDAKGRKTYA
jgi:transcriptional regulator with XRE-family HTH domain